MTAVPNYPLGAGDIRADRETGVDVLGSVGLERDVGLGRLHAVDASDAFVYDLGDPIVVDDLDQGDHVDLAGD